MLALSGTDHSPFDARTNTDLLGDPTEHRTFLKVFALLIPTFDSLLTLFSTILALGMSIFYMISRNREVKEEEGRSEQAQEAYGEIEKNDEEEENLLSDSKQEEKVSPEHAIRITKVIDEYSRLVNILLAAQFIILAFTAASIVSVTNIAYQIIFLVQGLILSISGKHSLGVYGNAWWWLNRILIVILVVELFIQYVVHLHLLFNSSTIDPSYTDIRRYDVIGLFENTAMVIVFGLKVILLLLYCQMLQFQAIDFETALADHVPAAVKATITRQKTSWYLQLLQSISPFIFCQIALIFLLLHPSVFFIPFMPFVILAMFSVPSSWYSFYWVSHLLISVTAFYVLLLICFQLYWLMADSTLLPEIWNEATFDSFLGFYSPTLNQVDIYMFFGLVRNDRVGIDDPSSYATTLSIFPRYQECFFFFMLVVFARYGNQNEEMSELGQAYEQEQEDVNGNLGDEFEELPMSDRSRASESDQKHDGRPKYQKCRCDLLKWACCFYEEVRDFFILHFTKFAQLCLFIVTVVSPSFVSALLFLMQIIISLSDNSTIKINWQAMLGLISVLLCFQYTMSVFRAFPGVHEVQKHPSVFACLTGILNCKEYDEEAALKSEWLKYTRQNAHEGPPVDLMFYIPMLTLLQSCTLAYYVLQSEAYRRLFDSHVEREVSLRIAKIQEERANQPSSPRPSQSSADLEQQHSELRRKIEHSVILCDPFTRYFIQHSQYILLISLALACGTLPTSIINVGYLVFMLLIAYRILKVPNLLTFYRESTFLFQSLNIYSIVCVSATYLALLQDRVMVLQDVTGEALPYEVVGDKREGLFLEDSEVYILASILGLKSTTAVWRLIYLTLILLITRIQMNVVSNEALVGILEETQETGFENSFYSQSAFKVVMIYLTFTLYSVLPVTLVVYIFWIAVTKISFFGSIILVVGMFILYRRAKIFWRDAYFTIGLLCLISIFVKVAFDFFGELSVTAYEPNMTDEQKENFELYFGFWRHNFQYFEQGEEKKGSILSGIVYLYVLLLLCIVVKYLRKYDTVFKQQANVVIEPQEEVEHQQEDEEHRSVDQTEPGQHQILPEERQDEEDVTETPQPPSEPIIQAAPVNKNSDKYLFEQCKEFRTVYLDIFMFNHGFSLVLFFSLISMLRKLNIMSSILAINFYYIYWADFYPNRIQQNQERYTEKRKVAQKRLKCLIICVTAIIFFEYFVLLLHDINEYLSQSGNSTLSEYASGWEAFVKESLCFLTATPGQPDSCYDDWNTWLSLGGQTPHDFFVVDISLLIISFTSKYYIDNTDSIADQLQNEARPRLGDENDFGQWGYSGRANRTSYKKLTEFVQYCIFALFPFILILVVGLCAVSFHRLNYSDVVMCLYLLFATMFLIKFRHLYTKNVKMLRTFRCFNIIVLLTLLTFQVPIFPCQNLRTQGADEPIYYIATQSCYQDPTSGGSGGQRIWYSVFLQSIGIAKLSADGFPSGVMMVFFVTEMQMWLFQHPYFETYVLLRMHWENLNSQMRAFIYVERIHLSRKWSYIANEEKMQILSMRLERVRRDYTQRALKQLYGDKDETRVGGTLSGTDTESENEDMLRRNTSLDDKAGGSEEEQITSQEILKKKFNRELLESIVMAALSTQRIPVAKYERHLLKDLQAQIDLDRSAYIFADDRIKAQKVKERLLALIFQVLLKNREKLYNQKGIGLYFAIEKDSVQKLQESDFVFFKDLFTKQYYEQLAIQNQDDNIEHLHDQYFPRDSEIQRSTIADDTAEPARHQGVGLNIEEKIDEALKEIIKVNLEEQDPTTNQVDEEEPLCQWFGTQIKMMLWSMTNKIIFYSVFSYDSMVEKKEFLKTAPFGWLLIMAFVCQIEFYCYLAMVLNFVLNPNLIHLVLPLSMFFYALLENPKPDVKYWKFITQYLVIVIFCKLLIQLPIFCSSPAFSMWNCDAEEVPPELLVTRVDFVLGLAKFSGPASYPSSVSILRGLLWNLVLLVLLVLLKVYMHRTGQWQFVRTDPDIHKTPCFRNKNKNQVVPPQEMAWYTKVYWSVYWFLLKILPNYRYQTEGVENQDSRTIQERGPTEAFVYGKVKPGRDYFSGNFFALLLLLVYDLLFHKKMTQIQAEMEKKYELSSSLSHFSIAQVFILFSLLMLMQVERMLYRIRTDYQHAPTHPSQPRRDIRNHILTIKLGILFILVILVHIILGFSLPLGQQTSMDQANYIIVFYLLWIVYFVFAALQIKHGYPGEPYEQAFFRDASTLRKTLYLVFKAIPFLWEMKVITDWTVTKTCLDLFQWFRLDDASMYIYYNKYMEEFRKSRYEYEQQGLSDKILYGFCFNLFLVLLILAPILLFSGFNPVMAANPIISGSLNLEFELMDNGNVFTIFEANAFNIQDLTPEEYDSMTEQFKFSDTQLDQDLFQRAQFTPYSSQDWLISQPSLERLIADFNKYTSGHQYNQQVTFRSKWSFVRKEPVGREVASGEKDLQMSLVDFEEFIDIIKLPQSDDGGVDEAVIQLDEMFPKMLNLGATMETHIIKLNPISESDPWFSMDLKLTRDNSNSGKLNWTFLLNENDSISFNQDDDNAAPDYVIILYNELVMNSVFAQMLSMSVIGIYVTVVYAIGRFLRLVFDRFSQRVIYEDLPDTERLREILEGIHISQLKGNMKTEKRLYDLLMLVYRSPELMLKMTGVKLKQKGKFPPAPPQEHQNNNDEDQPADNQPGPGPNDQQQRDQPRLIS